MTLTNNASPSCLLYRMQLFANLRLNSPLTLEFLFRNLAKNTSVLNGYLVDLLTFICLFLGTVSVGLDIFHEM